MAIDGPKAIDDAPACGPQQREGRQAGEFLALRGMGAAQGKKLARRRCGKAIEAQPAFGQIKPLKRPCGRAPPDSDQTGELATVVHWKAFGAPGETAPSSQPFRPVYQTNIADAERPRARPQQFIGLAPLAPPVPARASTAPLPGVARTIRQHPIMDQARSRATAIRIPAA